MPKNTQTTFSFIFMEQVFNATWEIFLLASGETNHIPDLLAENISDSHLLCLLIKIAPFISLIKTSSSVAW